MEKVWSEIVELYYLNTLGWNIAVGVLILLGLAYLPPKKASEGWLDFLPHGRGKMLRRQRRNFVRSMIIDELVTIVELRVFNGEITRAEAKEIYRDARKYWPVRDLFPAPELLKEAIKKRTASNTHAAVSLPDLKPKAKHMFDKLVKA